MKSSIRIVHLGVKIPREMAMTPTVMDMELTCHSTVIGKNYGASNQAKTVAASGVVAGVDWFKANAFKPATTNMSLGGSSNASLDAAVNALHNSGIPTVAAGNNNTDACSHSPAGATDGISVGSTIYAITRSGFSNWGSCVEIMAPGSGIKSAGDNADNEYKTYNGTSMASPHVCGGAALLLGIGTPAKQAMSKLDEIATLDKITGVNGSPNKLLFVGRGSEPSVSPRPKPNYCSHGDVSLSSKYSPVSANFLLRRFQILLCQEWKKKEMLLCFKAPEHVCT